MATTDKPTDASQPEDYGVEVLCASWNPVVSTAPEPVDRACSDPLKDRSAVDVDAFLKQYYCCQKS